MTIAAIPTSYQGVHFKSRLEARFAEMLDKNAVAWEYEPITSGVFRSYQPDFWLPRMGQGGLFVEIKPMKYVEELNMFWESEIWACQFPWVCVDKLLGGRNEWALIQGNRRFDGGLRYSPYPTPIRFSGVGIQILTAEVRFIGN